MTFPPIPALAGYALQALVAVQAWRLARLRPLHRPFAVLAAMVALADPARPLLAAMRHGGHPFAGTALASWHLDRALFAAWPVGLAAVAWQALAGRRVWPHAVGILLAGLAAQVKLYPHSAAPLVLPAVHLAALLAALVPALLWSRGRRWATEGERLVLGYVVAEAVVWPLVWAGGDARAAWPLSWGAYLVAVGAAAVGQAVWSRAIERETRAAKP